MKISYSDSGSQWEESSLVVGTSLVVVSHSCSYEDIDIVDNRSLDVVAE